MAICANCPAEAFYRYQVTDNYGIDYCQQHLPAFLRPQRDAGLLAIPEPVVEPKTSKKKEVPVEETTETPTEQMPLIRKFAIQGHPVPNGYTSARGPFPPELYITPRSGDAPERSDSLHEALDDVRMFRCRDCGEILYEDELDNHDCESET